MLETRVDILFFFFFFQEHPSEGVHVSAVGNQVTKAVAVVEVLKRTLQVGLIIVEGGGSILIG